MKYESRPFGRPVIVPADNAEAVYEVFRLSIARARKYLPVHRIPAKNGSGKAKYIFVVTECEDFARQLPLEPILLPPPR